MKLLLGLSNYNFIILSVVGFESTPSLSRTESRAAQMQKILQMESRQRNVLFGVCTLFVICHTFRIVHNFTKLYDLLNDINPTEETECNKGCASPYSFWRHVS